VNSLDSGLSSFANSVKGGYTLKLPLRIEVVSFSHKLAGENGCYPFIPPDENTFQYVFDMRLLPNPHTDPDLKDKTGLDGDVQAFVRPSIDPNQWFVMANDINELLGRTARVETDQPAVTIRFCLGCVGGNHRSVAVAQHQFDHLVRAYGAKVESITIRHLALETQGVVEPPDGQPRGFIKAA